MLALLIVSQIWRKTDADWKPPLFRRREMQMKPMQVRCSNCIGKPRSASVKRDRQWWGWYDDDNYHNTISSYCSCWSNILWWHLTHQLLSVCRNRSTYLSRTWTTTDVDSQRRHDGELSWWRSAVSLCPGSLTHICWDELMDDSGTRPSVCLSVGRSSRATLLVGDYCCAVYGKITY